MSNLIFCKKNTKIIEISPKLNNVYEQNISNRYKNMASIPIDGVDENFKIKSDVIDKNGYNVPVFEVRVSKDVVLFDQNRDLLKQEKGLMSVDGVNGPDIVLGSLSEVSTNGNWPTTYDAIARN